MIRKGYYLKARTTQDSAIAKCPPHIREVWDWLLLTASHEDTKHQERGQVICTYSRIQEELAWYVGWRKHTYTKAQIAQAMKTIRTLSMITTTKTPRSTLVTIKNYSRYQDPKNYASAIRNVTTSASTKPSRTTTLYNNTEELIINNKGISFKNKELQAAFSEFRKMRNKIKKPMTERAEQLIVKKLEGFYPGQTNMQIACLNQSIENCWQTLYVVKEDPAAIIARNKPAPRTQAVEQTEAQRQNAREAAAKVRKQLAEKMSTKTKVPPK